MPEFQCRVATASGEVVERSYVAADEAALRRELEAQDLMALAIRRRNPILQQIARALRLKGSISGREFLVFNQELSALLKAGLPILTSLDILLERRSNPTFKQALQDIRSRVKSGEALSEAFMAQGDLFPPLYAASLASGERTGELPIVLVRFVTYMQRVLSIQRKVVSSLIYPAILLTLAVGLIAVMVFFIIPKFNEFLQDFGADLPLITKIIVGISMFCIEHWHLILAATVGTVVGGLVWTRSGPGRVFLDRLKLKIPVVGPVFRNYAQNRFTRTLGTLQSGGLPLVTSLELSARAAGNAVFETELLKVTEKVREGRPMWESLDETELFSDISVQMIKVGESTGALVDMLEDASNFTDDDIDTQLTRMVSMIEPLMLVFMAVVVATMLLSIYLPLLQAYGQTGQA